MSVKGRVVKVVEKNGAMYCVVQMNGKLPAVGDFVTMKWGSVRSLSQNALYWVYLNWLIDHAGLKDQGHFSAEALHIDLKTHILAQKIFDRGKFKAIEEATTTDLNKTDFGEYLTKVEEVIKDIFNIDSAPFWLEHKKGQS